MDDIADVIHVFIQSVSNYRVSLIWKTLLDTLGETQVQFAQRSSHRRSPAEQGSEDVRTAMLPGGKPV